MARKTYNLSARVGRYTDSNGDERFTYRKVGVMMEGPHGPFIILDQSFNPAGAIGQDGGTLVSMFVPDSPGGYNENDPPPQSGNGMSYGASKPLDDDIPFSHYPWSLA